MVGGSLGAQALNEALPRALALMSERPLVVHQSGEKHLEALKKHYADAGVQGELVSFMTYPGEFHYFTREHVLRDSWHRVDEFFNGHLKAVPSGTQN